MMTRITGTSPDDDRAWLEYVGRRPKLAEWRSYKMMSAKTELAEEGKPGESIIDRLRKNEPYYAFMHDQVVGSGDDLKWFLDMDDDNALVYAVLGYYGEEYGMDEFVLHTWPRIPFKDAEKFLNNSRKTLNSDLYFQYFRVFCAKVMNMSIYSDEVVKYAMETDGFFLNVKDNMNLFQGWTNLDVFIETRFRYPYINNFYYTEIPLKHEDDLRTIDHDYLYQVLLKPKPDPTEISSRRWHDMSVKLVNVVKDQVLSLKMRNRPGSIEESFLSTICSSLYCFLGGDVEEMSFFETIRNFFDTNIIFYHVNVNGKNQIQYDLLVPILDYLREYGPAFATPLFERALDSDATAD